MGPNIGKWLRSLAHPRGEMPVEVLRVSNPARQSLIGDRIEVADRGERRRKGLLGRTGLATGEGLWIVPCEAVHTFGMKFSLDLIFLDRVRRVVKVKCGVRPDRISGSLRAHSVIELPPGVVESTHTQPGDVLVFDPAANP